MYKKPIIIFGIVVPIILAAIFVGVCVFVKGKFSESYQTKVKYYEGNERSLTAAAQIESKLGEQRENSKRWQELLDQDTFSLVTTNLRLIGEDLPPKEFQQTAFERLGNSGSLGSVTAQKSTGMRFNLRGTYRSVQKALLELETRMPNLQLQDLKISPAGNSEVSPLNFEVVYTVWEN